MHVSFTAALAATALFLIPCASPAQSLGEVAARERAKKKPKTTQVITNDDLGRRVRTTAPVSFTEAAPAEEKEASPAPAAAGKPEPSEEEQRADAQKAWREKMQAAQAEVARLKNMVDQIQFQLNDLTVSLYGPNRVSLMNKLEEAKKALTAAQQTVSDLEDQGRRSAFRQ